MIDRSGIRDGHETARVALDAVEAGIDAAHPDSVLADAIAVAGTTLHVADERYDLDAYDEVVVLGGGNAAGRIAAFLADRLGDALTGGVVVTDDPAPADPVEVVSGIHPVPSEANVDGARRVLDRARESDGDTLVLAPVTGGGSALLAAPAGDVTLDDLQALTDALLRSGAPIDRINCVRKHVSAIKGGSLADAIAPATAVGLVFSDVSSGDPAVVASGPLSPDPTTYADALDVLSRFDVDAPDAVVEHLRDGADGDRDETPTAGDPAFETVSVRVLADNYTALSAARDACAEAGFDTVVLSSSVRGEAREAAKTHVAIAEEVRRTGNPRPAPVAVLSGGETTVTIGGGGEGDADEDGGDGTGEVDADEDGDGGTVDADGDRGATGGPNQEFALSAAVELPADAVLCAVDTDGIDGPTDAAGALVDADTVDDDRHARDRLAAHDAYGYLDERGALVRTGKTGTNVNDLRVLLVADRSSA
ncbi:DUF4147 domain-containing protein [Halorubrum sp. CBA1125]|uniref:glycerate kinase type-2 family protein n=1 Tax=Halorubrum sp. CBA1125 TaxID=2668072 RepID=UPI0012E76D08|nr:DUF4147 domain-containing protein [Halorubrum sp. CBA1125]MUW14561.1 DUF4147 domain-containing protein [Halorubrum sp. CBA1125]